MNLVLICVNKQLREIKYANQFILIQKNIKKNTRLKNIGRECKKRCMIKQTLDNILLTGFSIK